MGHTAYQEVEAELARQLREAAIDHDAFSMPLKVCELSECRATCCHDGVLLTEEESSLIGAVIQGNRERLAGYGWRHESYLLERQGRMRSRTLETHDLAKEFPAHFPRTRCVFLDQEHRCVLQRLALDQNRHPWFWKPVSCWLHPLILEPGKHGARPRLTLARPGADPAADPGYPGFSAHTPCGMAQPGGRAAWQVLHRELELLGMIGERDLLGELSSGSTNRDCP